MDNENYKTSFSKKGIVGMSRTEKLEEEKSSSGFFITFRPLDILDKYVAVGEVVDGLEQLEEMSKNNQEIKIIKSGQIGMIDLD